MDDNKVTKTMTSTVTKTTEFRHRAECLDCSETWDKRNAAALASMHARSKGHLTRASSTVVTDYDGRPPVDQTEWEDVL